MLPWNQCSKSLAHKGKLFRGEPKPNKFSFPFRRLRTVRIFTRIWLRIRKKKKEEKNMVREREPAL